MYIFFSEDEIIRPKERLVECFMSSSGLHLPCVHALSIFGHIDYQSAPQSL